MKAQLDRIMKAEKKAQKDLDKARTKREELVDTAITKATEEANLIKQEMEEKIQTLIANKKDRLAEIEEQLQNVVKLENEKIVNKVSNKVARIADNIYKEAIGE